MRGKLWSDKPWCSLFVGDNPLTDDGAGRGLAGAMGGMSKFTSIFHIMRPDIKEHIGLLAEYRSNITGRYNGVIHLIPEAIASFYVAEVMASMAIKTSVDQHCIQDVNNRLSIGLRHIWPNIKILRIFHILSNFSTSKICKTFQRKCKNVRGSMDSEPL